MSRRPVHPPGAQLVMSPEPSAQAEIQAFGASDATALRWEQRLVRGGAAIELLRLPAALFGLLVRLRGAAYDAGLLPRAAAGVPVVSVGNLTAGGTGKTPFVLWLARGLARRGARPGVLARGHARERGEALNDEGRMLAAEWPELLQEQDRDRVRGARRLVLRGAEVLVLDDGFQHRRLARDLDLVLVDATRPFGLEAAGGRPAPRALLPRGLLREPPSALARADLVLLTRVEQVEARELALLEDELERWAPGKPRLWGAHRPRALRAPGGGRDAPEALRGREVDLASAIGSPAAFERTVRALGARVASHLVRPDHHAWRAEELRGLGRARPLVVTAKDAPKLAGLGLAAHVLEVGFELVRGAAVLEAMLDSLPLGSASKLAVPAGAEGALV